MRITGNRIVDNLDCNKWNLFLDYESKSGKGVES